MHYFKLPQLLSHTLQAKVADFILNYQWHFPSGLLVMFPDLKEVSNNIVIPIEPK